MTSPSADPGQAGAPGPGAPSGPPEAAGPGSGPAAAGAAVTPAREPLLPGQSREDTDAAWGEYPGPADDRLHRDRPPHWDDI
jgi:hypothetical protein